MKQTQKPTVIEGTWEQIAKHAEELKGKKLRLAIIPDEATEVALNSETQSLAEFLGSFVGCVSGSGENNSDETGRRFTEYLEEKHKAGYL